MAHQRTQSTAEGVKHPHSVSLKVLRLARPSLPDQYPLPRSTESDISIPISSSLSYPSAPDQDATPFTIGENLQLPSSFGAAYVGETFACTLCANNELPSAVSPNASLSVSGIRITAEIQTPAQPNGIGLSLQGTGEDAGPGESVQRVLKYELSEEGNHVLAVTVTYSEILRSSDGLGAGGGGASGGRVRTFRKLYQFVAQQLLNVRTKAGDLPPLIEGTGEKKIERERYALEAQLENMGHAALSLEAVTINPNPIFKTTSLNWDFPSHPAASAVPHNPILNPRDVLQVAFLLEEQALESIDATSEGISAPVPKLPPGDQRTVLGQLAIQWRGSLGDRGSLRTAWLLNRR
ncbi:hypothetical protein EJ05DRAFT_304982 [Pseudovirgaria hyperparasitica]|uniref:DUF974-domain-containing protein n=1 Tax=Pseudovirgaria hyperparasitica TaxID=470096 RepID=A0A6A6W9U2_9PEZI|nr:uncharacterized protein EJ05DRAFT_304982 [Pseudovirgaria hyperparasitica]KAF2759638.1 hypothetical protein EJ05DRAFT_304982 [Pseudovirgaria hyperparasitica]